MFVYLLAQRPHFLESVRTLSPNAGAAKITDTVSLVSSVPEYILPQIHPANPVLMIKVPLSQESFTGTLEEPYSNH